MHASSREQLLGSAERHFGGASELVVLAIDEARVEVPLRWEDTSGRGERYPHLYGPVPTAAVVAAARLARGPEGRFGPLPAELP